MNPGKVSNSILKRSVLKQIKKREEYAEMCIRDRPDVQGRLEILNVHAAKKPLGDDVDL